MATARKTLLVGLLALGGWAPFGAPTPAAAQPAEAAPPYVSTWELPAAGMALGPDGLLYVSSPGALRFPGFPTQGVDRVEKLDLTGTSVGSFGANGTGPGQFTTPEGIAVDPSGAVYVVDYGNNRVQKFTAAGAFVTQWGSRGSGQGQFDDPGEIAVHQGHVFVADGGNHRVQKFTTSGAFVDEWTIENTGSENNPDRPWGLAVSAGGTVYVGIASDGGDDRIGRYSTSGSSLGSWSNPGVNNGLGIGPDGSVYVADGFHSRITRYSSSGTQLARWGSFGDEPGQFVELRDVVVDATGSVYASSLDDRIQKFGTPQMRPDARVRRGSQGTLVGDGVYNADGTDQTATADLAPGGKVNYQVSVQNDGRATDRLKVRGPGSNLAFRVRYFDGAGRVISPAVVAGTYTTRRLAPGEAATIRVEVTLRDDAPPPACAPPCHELLLRPVTVTSRTEPDRFDVVRTVTTRVP